jgi:hypothetical protein
VLVKKRRQTSKGETVMSDNSNIDDAQAYQQPPEPSPDLKSLGRLVGTWNVSGPEILGRITFEWMEGGFFLIQRIDFDHAGRRVKGIEIIGHERRFGAEPSEEIKSRVYSNSGDTLDYVYELEGDTLTIWAGRGEGLPSVLQGHIQRRRRHPHRRLALPGGRRLRGDLDQSQVDGMIRRVLHGRRHG